MTARILISHSVAHGELAGHIAEFLQIALPGVRVSASALPGVAPTEGEQSLAALKDMLSSADVVVGLITPDALASGEVAFQLGAAWVLGRRVVLLLGPADTLAGLYLPMGHAETVVLGPEALSELASSLAPGLGLSASLGAAARAVLQEIFPDAQLDRESSERPVAAPARPTSATTQQLWAVDENGRPSRPPPPMPAPESAASPAPASPAAAERSGPSLAASLQAGRAISDCVFHRAAGGPFAAELDGSFGTFLSALGTNWEALRALEDLDVWLEAAENVLDPAGRSVRGWYLVGFELATLLNLAAQSLEGASADVEQRWQTSWRALEAAAAEAQLDPVDLGEIRLLLENLNGPARDLQNAGRAQQRLSELAEAADGRSLAASA
jgi:hypothetical protein